MKRAALAVFVFSLSLPVTVAAQDAFSPLIYAEEVAQTAKMVQQIQNQLQEISYIYQSLKDQIQSLSNLKVSSYNDFMDFLNGQASYILTTESRIKSLQIYVDGQSYAIDDVLGYMDAYKRKMDAIASGNGTSSDEYAAYELFGISNDLVTVANQLKDLTTSAARKSTALTIDTEKQAKDDQEKIDNLLEQSQGDQSIVAGLQTSALLEGEIAQELLDLKLQLGSLATNVAAFTTDVQRNGVPVARSPEDREIVGEEIGNPLSSDFFDSK